MNAPDTPRAAPAHPVPILTYHQIAPPPARGVPYRSLVTSPDAFARQLGWLHSMGWRGMSMRQLEPYLRGEKSGKVVGITMDDGYANCFEHGLPVLRYYGFSATCYVVSGLVGGTNSWDRALGVPERPLMDARQLKAWLANGQDIGAHTRTHADLLTLDEPGAREQIRGSRDDLEDLLDTEVRHFCYPYGRLRPEHSAYAREAGFVTGTTAVCRRTHEDDSLHALPRLTVELAMAPTQIAARVAFGSAEEFRWNIKRLAGQLLGRPIGAQAAVRGPASAG